MCERWLAVLGVVVAFTVPGVADEPAPRNDQKPPYDRLLSGDDAARAEELQEQADAAEQADRYEEAIRFHEQLLALRTQVQGADHWETVNQKWALDRDRKVAALPAVERAGWRQSALGAAEAQRVQAIGRYAEAEALWQEHRRWCRQLFDEHHPDTAASYDNTAQCLHLQGRYAEVEPLFQQALDVRIRLLGEDHPETFGSRSNLALSLDARGRYADALPLLRTALRQSRQVLGDHDRDTAAAYNNLAFNLEHLGRYVESLTQFQKALDITRELLGEHHPNTARVYNNMAHNLNAQGRHGDAQPLFQRALDLRRELLGERHPLTAVSYNNLALNLNARGRYADAQPVFHMALDLHIQLLTERHPNTARIYGNLATNLSDQGRYADAQPLFQRALDLHRELLGEDHVDTAVAYGNLGRNLRLQRRYDEAEASFRHALQLQRGLLGERHLDTATSCSNLAGILYAQGRYGEAQSLDQKVLEVYRELLGERHPTTAGSYDNLAANLNAQRQYAKAQPLYQKALDLRRELLGEHHPDTAASYNNLAMNLNAHGQNAEALMMLESGAASYEAARLSVAGRGLDRATFGAKWSPYRALAATQARLREARGAWHAAEADLARGISDEASARRQVARTVEEQRLQVELTSRLSEIEPRVLQLVTKGSPSEAEQDKLNRLKAERQQLEVELSGLAVSLSQRELAGLEQVQAALATDAALVLWIDVTGSGVQEHWGCVVRSSGEPGWEPLSGSGPERTWTDEDAGLPRRLRGAVVGHAPASEIADLAQTLYAQRIGPLEQHLEGVRRLFVVPVNEMAGVPIDVLTDKYNISYVPSGTFQARRKDHPNSGAHSLLALGDPVFPAFTSPEESPLPPGGLLTTQGVPGGDAAPAEAIVAKRQTDQVLALLSRGGEWSELPGTSVEVAGLKTLMGDDHTTALTRSDASEQSLEQLRESGKLKDFRYLHFATHGEPNNARAFESALILAQDQISGEIPKGGGKYYDGRLTANEVLENWELNADLVTLSACESALARPGGGDGLLGFAQAFLLAGARSVCLSLWKVDDTATALLMDRFYRNLLGKRDGLEQPMPKAEALAEAKQWLRTLGLDEAKQLWQGMATGVERGTGEAALPVVPDPQVANGADDYPYSHPRYWAAFILIGDPE